MGSSGGTGPTGPPGPIGVVAQTGVPVTARPELNLLAGLTATDNLANTRTDVGLSAQVPLLNVANTFTQPVTVQTAAAGIQHVVGPGTPYGQPPTAPTLGTGGAGGLMGNYYYAYLETDPIGSTPLSPASSVYNAAGEKILVTLPLPRRGTSSRALYRTKTGGSAAGPFYFVSGLTSAATGYHQTGFIDNVADALLGAALLPGGADTTAFYRHMIDGNGLIYSRCLPTDSGAADFTNLMSDASISGSYSFDCYGQIFIRTLHGVALQTSVTGSGTGAQQIGCYNIPATNPDVTAQPVLTEVFGVTDIGNVSILPCVDGSGSALAITQLAGAMSNVFQYRQIGDTQDRVHLSSGGIWSYGPGGATAPDTITQRTAVGRWQVSNTLDVAQSMNIGAGAIGGSGDTLALATLGSQDATFRVGTQSWGNFQIIAQSTTPGRITVRSVNNVPLSLASHQIIAVTVDTSQNVILGPAAQAAPAELATTATTALLYVPTMNGTPTGAPSAITGACPMVVDRAGSKLWVYIGGAWKGVAVA